MREIKFRVAEFDEDGVFQDITYFDAKQEFDCKWLNYSDPLTKIQFYTGLKDKNSKEIYEGDIVKGMSLIFKDKVYRKGVVEYSHSSFIATPVDMEKFNHVALGEWCEVIGNIYENPELLK